MHVPASAVRICKLFEGLHKVVTRKPYITVAPYICPAGYWTIGYGHLCSKEHKPITEYDAELYLEADMWKALHSTLALCPVLIAEPEDRLAAIVDFTFNLGSGRLKASTLRRRVNQRDWGEAAYELSRWVWGGGKKLPGLIARREAEVSLLRLEGL